jgi:hypothetical protein
MAENGTLEKEEMDIHTQHSREALNLENLNEYTNMDLKLILENQDGLDFYDSE